MYRINVAKIVYKCQWYMNKLFVSDVDVITISAVCGVVIHGHVKAGMC